MVFKHYPRIQAGYSGESLFVTFNPDHLKKKHNIINNNNNIMINYYLSRQIDWIRVDLRFRGKEKIYFWLSIAMKLIFFLPETFL